MLKKLTYPVLLAMFLVFAASCQKEDVKPFNGGNSGTCGFGEQRDGSGDPGTGGSTTGTGGGATTEDPGGSTTTTTTDEGEEGGGITDGGNSSEHDSKGKRGKKP